MPTEEQTSNQGFWNFGTVSHRFVPPGRPTTSMLGLHTSKASSSQNLHAQLPPLFTPRVAATFPTPQQTLTSNSLAALRQQMEESNHEMVNMVIQHIGKVINPLIRDTNTSYERLSAQIERIANYFGAPPTRNVPGSQETNTSIEVPTERNTNQLTENRVLR